MIEEKDVIRMKVPYPNIDAGLALQAHMYICRRSQGFNYGFVKCQTLKPYMLRSNVMSHYIDEPADITRNPFRRAFRIDCDKLFTTSSVCYDDDMKTDLRHDVCQDLYNAVVQELNAQGHRLIAINEDILVSLNSGINKVDL